MPSIAFIGLSDIGVALASAVRPSLRGATLAGFDPDAAAARRALEAGAIDEAPGSMAAALAGVELVVLSSPLGAARDALRIIGESAPSECVVTDTCPLKTPVLRWAEERLPRGMQFVGGRPVLRAQGRGAATPSFDGTDYAIVPGTGASSEAIEAVSSLAEAAGASPFFLDPAEHDSFVIATEYLPRIAAAAAVDAVSTSPAWRDARRLQADAFSRAVDTAAELDAEALAIAMEYAPDTLVSWLNRLAGGASSLRDAALAKPDAAAAAERLAALAAARLEQLHEPPPSLAPTMGRQSLSSFLLGDWLTQRARRSPPS